jgi:signal transduction histidine kinase
LTTQIGRNVHQTAWELRPTSLDDVGLVRALQTYVTDWGERFGIRVDFHAGDQESSQYPADIETTAYRVVQEALTNVLKHAAASTVSLVLECHEGSLQIIVEDDGKGFDPEKSDSQSRLGLAGMRERLSMVGGTLAIDSEPAAGTTLYIRIPLREPRDRSSEHP